ncbi:hypothetical protein [Okeania sp. SIO3B5]
MLQLGHQSKWQLWLRSKYVRCQDWCRFPSEKARIQHSG